MIMHMEAKMSGGELACSATAFPAGYPEASPTSPARDGFVLDRDNGEVGRLVVVSWPLEAGKSTVAIANCD